MRTAAPPLEPYRPPVPAAEALARWPAGFGQRFTIMVDTEEEFDWSRPLSRETHSTATTDAIPAAAARFADHGAALTYLVDYPVANDPTAADAINRVLSDGRSAVGTQLHPWVNPPLAHDRRAADSFAGNLPLDLHAAKLDRLTDAISRAFGRRPIIYRAGRYGIGPDTLELLTQRGYRFDSSIRARYDYGPARGPDFRAIGNAAFYAGTNNAIVELPFTTVFTGKARRIGATLGGAAARSRLATGMLARTGLVSRVSLTPEDMPLDAVLEAIRVVAGEGLALMNFAFHSPSLVPGHTPYVRDAADLAHFWTWWDGVFALLGRLGIDYATLAEIDAALWLGGT